MELFLNELSLPIEGSMEDAKVYLKGIVNLVRTVRTSVGAVSLNSDVPIKDLILGGATVSELRNQGMAEESLFLKALENRAPFSLVAEQLHGPDPTTYEYSCVTEAGNAEVAVGLGLAHVHDSLGVSFAREFWHRPEVELSQAVLQNDAELGVQSVIARNACCPAELATHNQWIRDRQLTQYEDGNAIWAARSLLFPNLEFIPRTEAQIRALRAGTPEFTSAIGRLAELDRAVRNWKPTDGGLPPYESLISAESESRVKEGLVSFNDRDGMTRVFSDHSRYTPGAQRVHFILETTPKKIALVGHVGRKLGIG